MANALSNALPVLILIGIYLTTGIGHPGTAGELLLGFVVFLDLHQ